ncbi:MAG: radical SAM protein [Candidatus Woesearchaeota archaeon]
MSQVILFAPISDPLRVTFTLPPWAMLHVAAPLAEHGYSVCIIDQNTDLHWEKRLKQELGMETILVGVTAMTGSQLTYVIEFVKKVRSIAKVPVVWGGGHASVFPEQTIRSEHADIVVAGEGEETILELAWKLKEGSTIKDVQGIWHKENGQVRKNPERQFIEMDMLPKIPYDLINPEKYIFKTSYASRNFELCTSRGCTHGCKFCYNLCVNRQKWRAKSAERVVAELKNLVQNFDIDGLNWRDDNFFTDKKRVEEICRLMIQEGLLVKWHADARVDYFDSYDDDFINLMKKAGLRRLTLGVESGSQRILDQMKKDITTEQVLRVNEKLKKHRIQCMYHFSFGYPKETMDDARQTVILIDKLLKNNPEAGVWPPSMYTPYPGTPMFEEAVKSGFTLPEKLEDFSKFAWESSNLPWLKEEYAKKLEAAVYIITGYASRMPLSKKWFGPRFRKLLEKSDPGSIMEKPFVDFMLQSIRSSKLVSSLVPQMG